MSKSVGVLLPYQKRWIADKSPVKLAEKSRRVGLSWCEAADDVLIAGAASGMDVWYIGYNKDMAFEFINDCAGWAAHYDQAAGAVDEILIDDEDKDILSYRITFASGHRITALSSRPNNLRGKQGKVVIDEAAFHDDLPELLKAAIALLMWGGRVVIISTHNGETNYFNELIKEIKAGKKPYSHHRITLDDALEQGLYKQICKKLKKEWTPEAEMQWRADLYDFYGSVADEELGCIPSSGSGVFLKLSELERVFDVEIPVVRLKLEDSFSGKPDEERTAFIAEWCADNLSFLKELPQMKSFVGGDFARTADLTVFDVAQEDATLRLPCRAVVELRNVPYTEQEFVYKYICDSLPRFSASALDARGNGGYLAERAVQRYGSRVAAIQTTEKFYADTMPKMQVLIQDGDTTIPKDSDIVSDLRSLQLVKGIAKPTDKRRPAADGGYRHGDAAIAKAMCVYAAKIMEAGGEPEYESCNSEPETQENDEGENWRTARAAY